MTDLLSSESITALWICLPLAYIVAIVAGFYVGSSIRKNNNE